MFHYLFTASALPRMHSPDLNDMRDAILDDTPPSPSKSGPAKPAGRGIVRIDAKGRLRAT